MPELNFKIEWDGSGYVISHDPPVDVADRVRLVQLSNRIMEMYARMNARRPWRDVRCGHCGKALRGFAAIWNADKPDAPIRVCHPAIGMDCYRLMTVYNHPLSCEVCAGLLPDEGEQRAHRKRRRRASDVRPGQPTGS